MEHLHFTHLAGKEHASETVAALARTAGFLRSELSHRFDLYSVPQLHFMYDDSIESGMRLSQLIDSLLFLARAESPQTQISREILTEILVDTEEHIDFLETQLALLGSLGEQNYLQSAMGQLEG